MELGMKSILNDLGIVKRLKVMTDSSAAKGIASRKGVGKSAPYRSESIMDAKQSSSK